MNTKTGIEVGVEEFTTNLSPHMTPVMLLISKNQF